MKPTNLSNESILLNTFFTGLYISATDLIAIGSAINLELSMQDRTTLLKSLIDYAKNSNQQQSLKNALFTLLEEREASLKDLLSSYPNAKAPLEVLINNIEKTKHTIESTLHTNNDT